MGVYSLGTRLGWAQNHGVRLSGGHAVAESDSVRSTNNGLITGFRVGG